LTASQAGCWLVANILEGPIIEGQYVIPVERGPLPSDYRVQITSKIDAERSVMLLLTSQPSNFIKNLT